VLRHLFLNAIIFWIFLFLVQIFFDILEEKNILKEKK